MANLTPDQAETVKILTEAQEYERYYPLYPDTVNRHLETMLSPPMREMYSVAGFGVVCDRVVLRLIKRLKVGG